MVHALSELRRVLTLAGTLIDLRPLAGNWPVEVVSAREKLTAGYVDDLPAGLEDDAAANAAMSEAENHGLFRRDKEEHFRFNYYWSSPSEMQEYVEEEWADFITIDPAVWGRIRSLWAVANADARVRVRLNMLITRWIRTDDQRARA
jgi:hypothetical protein